MDKWLVIAMAWIAIVCIALWWGLIRTSRDARNYHKKMVEYKRLVSDMLVIHKARTSQGVKNLQRTAWRTKAEKLLEEDEK